MFILQEMPMCLSKLILECIDTCVIGQNYMHLFMSALKIMWVFFLQAYHFQSSMLILDYSGPSILRPLMGPRKCGHILQVVLK